MDSINIYHVLANYIRYYKMSDTYPEMSKFEKEHSDVVKFFYNKGDKDYDIIYEAVTGYLKDHF